MRLNLDTASWIDEEIKYWTQKKKIPVETSVEELNRVEDSWTNQISIIKIDDFNNNLIVVKQQPVMWYTVENKDVVLVPEYFITKEILEDVTFNGYLNPVKII